MARIAIAGSLNMDLVAGALRIPAPGETILGTHFFTGCGGKGGNQAYAVAKLGAQAAMLGCVGDDDFGRTLRANLIAVNCNVEGVAEVAGPSGVALIVVAATGENSIVVAPGANLKFNLDAARLDGARLLLLQLEVPLLVVEKAAREARRRGVQVVLDPAPGQALPDELLRNVDILTPNETEAAILAGIEPGKLTLASAESIASQLRARGAAIVIVKLGEQGCLLVEECGATHFPAPAVKAMDTTAAGDVFNAALAVGLSEGLSLPEACELAVAAASLSVTRRGAQASVPSREEVAVFRNAL